MKKTFPLDQSQLDESFADHESNLSLSAIKSSMISPQSTTTSNALNGHVKPHNRRPPPKQRSWNYKLVKTMYPAKRKRKPKRLGAKRFKEPLSEFPIGFLCFLVVYSLELWKFSTNVSAARDIKAEILDESYNVMGTDNSQNGDISCSSNMQLKKCSHCDREVYV